MPLDTATGEAPEICARDSADRRCARADYGKIASGMLPLDAMLSGVLARVVALRTQTATLKDPGNAGVQVN